MLHPVGDLATSVYWRRRILLLAALALAIVSVYAVAFHRNSYDKNNATATNTTPESSAPAASASAPSSASDSSTPSQTTSGPPAPKACSASQLTIAAATDATSYQVGARPKVALVVTNKGPQPCVSDLADHQIELRVFSGTARVWGSHDCAVEPGTSPQTLPVAQPIRREIEWSGLSSQPGCAGTRQRVAAGSYTLFALLGRQQGKSAPFSFTG